MRVLVTYGSTRGGTEGLAHMIGDRLREKGLEVDVLAAGQVVRLETYSAVVIGGALYAMRWHKDSRKLVRRNAAELRRLPTFFFSSGPLDDSASKKDIPPVAQVKAAMELVGSRWHKTFGGRLEPNAKGLIASRMAKRLSGDWRDAADVEGWASFVAEEIRHRVAEGTAA